MDAFLHQSITRTFTQDLLANALDNATEEVRRSVRMIGTKILDSSNSTATNRLVVPDHSVVDLDQYINNLYAKFMDGKLILTAKR